MGHVVYLHRGRQTSEPQAPARARPESLLRPGYNCCAVARAERVAFLVDAAAYFRAFHEAALRARRSIAILGWDFNSQTQLHFDPVPPGGPPARLGEFLNYLVRRRRRLHVHVLDWDYPMVFGADREFPPLYGFGWKPARRVHLRYDDTHPIGGSQHQKIVVIDGAIAFVGGIDLTARRWDTCDHRPDDPRRVADGAAYPPFHDLMLAVDGDAARALDDIVHERWRLATGRELLRVQADHDPWPAALAPDLRNVDVGIARTMPPRGDAPAVREIERLYLDMIPAARKHIYIENQYFTSPRIAAELEKRLAEPDGPEIVLVLRLLSHGWLEEATMHVLRTRLIRRLREADRHGRFRVYYPHVPGLPEGRCVDVHSKLMIVDDRMLRLGSANLCNRSMGMDTECDALIESRGQPEVAVAIRRFRDSLVAEHLDVPPARLEEALASSGGSLIGAIEALRCERRSLRELEQVKEWPEAVIQLASVADPEEPIAVDFLRDDRTYEEPPLAVERPAWGQLALIALVIAALTALWRYTPMAELVTAERVIDWAQDFGSRPWAPWVVVLAYTPASLLMFPRPLITLAGVIAFGPLLGALYAFVGVVLAAIATFYIGKAMRRDTVRRLAGRRLDRMAEVMKKRGLLALTLLRLVPLAPFPVTGMVAGAIGMPPWQVAVATAIGMAPGILAMTYFGEQVATALSGGGVNWWLVAAMVLVLAVGAVLVKRWFSRMAARSAGSA